MPSGKLRMKPTSQDEDESHHRHHRSKRRRKDHQEEAADEDVGPSSSATASGSSSSRSNPSRGHGSRSSRSAAAAAYGPPPPPKYYRPPPDLDFDFDYDMSVPPRAAHKLNEEPAEVLQWHDKLYQALGEDEGLEFFEGLYGNHVPSRWRDGDSSYAASSSFRQSLGPCSNPTLHLQTLYSSLHRSHPIPFQRIQYQISSSLQSLRTIKRPDVRYFERLFYNIIRTDLIE